MNKRGCPQGAGGAQERTLVAQQGRNQRLKEAWRGLLRGTCKASCSVRAGKVRLLGLAEQLRGQCLAENLVSGMPHSSPDLLLA